MDISFKSLFTILIYVAFTQNSTAQMLRTSGTKVVNVDNNNSEIILKGLNTNNWLLQEGYMMEFGGAQWEIEAKIDELVGEENRHDFYDKWRANYYTKADIDSMAAWGFNSVRAPFHYKWISPLDTPGVIYERGLVELDSIISWCAQNNLWCILDMHAAPGGQGENRDINDFDPSKPSLYESVANQDKFVEVWLEIATRYKDNPWVGGYDLINEPNKADLDEQLFADVYQRAIDAIRTVDTNHIIFVEGQWFATSFSDELRNTIKVNDNVAWSFHKYWNANDQGSIQYILDMSQQDDMPLWLGETGENSNAWYSELAALCADHDIGWAWWGTKKIESISSFFEIPRPASYATFANVANNGGTMSVSDGVQALDDIAAASLNENNSFNMDVVYSLVGNPGGALTYPYTTHIVPGEIYASDFDMGPIGEAYYDIKYSNTGNGADYNAGWVYRNDGIDVGYEGDVESNNYYVGWNEPSEWMKYTVEVQTTGYYQVFTRVKASGNGGVFVVSSDDNTGKVSYANSTAQVNKYEDIPCGYVYLEQGTDAIYFSVIEGGFDFNKITLNYHGLDGVEEDDLETKGIVLSPNPTNGLINIYGNIPTDTYEINITDLTGRFIMSDLRFFDSSSLDYSLNLSGLSLESGMYLISLVGSEGNLITERFRFE